MNRARIPRSIPLSPFSIKDVRDFHASRRKADTDFSSYDIDICEANQVFRILRHSELHEVAPDYDYGRGAAEFDDQLIRIGGEVVMITAEHATDQKRLEKDGSRKRKAADAGTGALALVTARETNSHAIVAIGRQTGDANNDDQHLVKEAMSRVISWDTRVHIALHAMTRALAARIDDLEGFKILIGRGRKPSPATNAFIDFLIENGRDLGLRTGVNKAIIDMNVKTWRPNLTKHGNIKRKLFEAPSYTTRGHSQAEAERLGKGDEFVAVELELGPGLRVMPPGFRKQLFKSEGDPDSVSARNQSIGAWLGHEFLKKAVESVGKL